MEKNPESQVTPPRPLTPMLAQYLEIKKNHPDSILFYRMGDFYEMFFDDALTAAPVLEVQLTSRDRSADNPIPMCGIPFHSVTPYLQKLLAQGFKVALCEQVEDPATAKGIVRREVIRVFTPALIGDPDLVPEETRNWLACMCEPTNVKSDELAEVCLLDLLGGQVRLGSVSTVLDLFDLFSQSTPKELLISESLWEKNWVGDFFKNFPQVTVTKRTDYFDKESSGTEKDACTFKALTKYLSETQKLETISYLSDPSPLFESHCLRLDTTSAWALEIVRGAGLGDGPTLFKVLDRTLTPMGKRNLRDWLTRPLGKVNTIEERLAAVAKLLENNSLCERLKTELSQIRDLERLTTKTALGLAMPRDLVAIRDILQRVPALKTALGEGGAPLLKKLAKQLSPLTELTVLLNEALEDIAPATLRDGGIFRESYRSEIAELRGLSRDGKSTIAAIESREKTRTGINSLKVRYSKVFGYTIEITRSYLNKVPSEYIRKQTIANGERFITEELKNFEEKIITADHKLKTLEESLFLQLRSQVGENAQALLVNAKTIADLDVLLSFSRVAKERGYCRPEIHDGWDLSVEEGRHPVVETLLSQGQFIPNSLGFSEAEVQTWLITGPNMGGKSTIMRQVALIVLMAHAGSFVPARTARIPLTDAIFTRIGSSDDLARGRSTFMVEMNEVARILSNATPRSLLIIDEIGRGTSTYDGLSLAWSLLEFIHQSLRAKTLFATHFHELTQLEKSLPGLKNANVLVEKWKDDIVFLYRLAPGICSQSYGIEVARLAGLPSPVLIRAKEILGLLEGQSQRANRTRSRALEIHDNQMVFFDDQKPSENRLELEN